MKSMHLKNKFDLVLLQKTRNQVTILAKLAVKAIS